MYTMLIWAVALGMLVFFMFLGHIGGMSQSENICMYCVFGSLAAIVLIVFIYYIQFAIIDEKGIIIRGLFYRIVKIQWNEIAEITCEKIVTYDNRTNVLLSWLLIKRDKAEFVKGRAGRNKRNKSPWCIIATERNKEIISRFYDIFYEQQVK